MRDTMKLSIGLCVLTLLTIKSEACETGRIYFGNVNETYPELLEKTGIFLKQENEHLSRPIYKHEELMVFMYFYEGKLPGGGYWVVGPEIGSMTADFAARTQAKSPEDIRPGKWQFYSEEAWFTEPALQARCVPPVFARCTTGKLNVTGLSDGNHRQDSMLGIYTLQEYTHELRPVYRLQDGDEFLFYNGGLWLIGPDVNARSGHVFVRDPALRPELITSTWVVFNGRHLIPDPSLKILCQGVSAREVQRPQPAHNLQQRRRTTVGRRFTSTRGEREVTPSPCDVNLCVNSACVDMDEELFMCLCDDYHFGPICSEERACFAPPPIVEHGTVVTPGGENGSPYLDLAFYTCDDGYVLIGTRAAVCGADGEWQEVPNCQPSLIIVEPEPLEETYSKTEE